MNENKYKRTKKRKGMKLNTKEQRKGLVENEYKRTKKRPG